MDSNHSIQEEKEGEEEEEEEQNRRTEIFYIKIGVRGWIWTKAGIPLAMLINIIFPIVTTRVLF